MKSLFLTLALVALLTPAGTAQTLQGFSPGQPYGLVIGHSDAGVQYRYLTRDFPGIQWQAISHYSEPCSYLLWSLTYDVKLVKNIPSYIFVHIGTTDVDNVHTPPAEFMQCLTSYITALQNYFPQAHIAVPNVEPYNFMTLLPPARYRDNRPYVEALNAAEADPITGLQVWFPSISMPNIHDALSLSNGWAIPSYITYIDPTSLGWQVADSEPGWLQ